MDIYEYLKLDHQHVDKLFKQFEDSQHIYRKVQIIQFLIRELLAHAKSEEETFYKALKGHYETQDEAFHGEEEHEEIKALISKLLNPTKADAHWTNQVLTLKKLVKHHVKEEEGEIFKFAQKVLSEEEAYRLKEQMHYLKQKYLRKFESNYEKERCA